MEKLQSNCESKIPPTHLHPTFPGICPPGSLPRLWAQKGHCSVVPPSCPCPPPSWCRHLSRESVYGKQHVLTKQVRPQEQDGSAQIHKVHVSFDSCISLWQGRDGWQAFCRHLPELCPSALTSAVAWDQDDLMNIGCNRCENLSLDSHLVIRQINLLFLSFQIRNQYFRSKAFGTPESLQWW